MSNSLWSHGLQPARLLCPWDSPGKNAGVGSHSLLQGIFPTQGSNPGLLHCRRILYWVCESSDSESLQKPYIVTCIHDCAIIQSNFTTLKILCTLPVHPHLPHPLSITSLYTVSVDLFFQNVRDGIIQYVTFYGWLLSLCNMHLRFLHIF